MYATIGLRREANHKKNIDQKLEVKQSRIVYFFVRYFVWIKPFFRWTTRKNTHEQKINCSTLHRAYDFVWTIVICLNVISIVSRKAVELISGAKTHKDFNQHEICAEDLSEEHYVRTTATTQHQFNRSY